MSVDITVVLPTLNRGRWLEECLNSILNQQTRGDFEFEVVVVDNGSTDNTTQLLARLEGTHLRWVHEPVRSESRARNAGIKASKGDWLAFIDDDELAQPDWLWRLLTTARKARVDIVGGAVHLPESVNDSVHTWTKELLSACDLGRTGPFPSRLQPGTGNALVRRRVVDLIGGFDQALTLGSDTEFFNRAKIAGFELWFCREAGVLHRVTPDRLTEASLLARAMWQGEKFVDVIHRNGGVRLLLWAAVRLLHTVLKHGTGLLLCVLRRDEPTRLGHLIRIWRYWGFLRGTVRRFARGPRQTDIPRFD